MDKDRQIVSELRDFFTESGCGLGVQRIMNVLETINITERQMAFEKKPNCKFTCSQIIQMMILFPFFSIKNAGSYLGSSLQSLFDCRKDMFYRIFSNHECKSLLNLGKCQCLNLCYNTTDLAPITSSEFMAYCLLDRKLDDFVTMFYSYDWHGIRVPRHYQEALLLTGDIRDGVKIDPAILRAYRGGLNAFSGMDNGSYWRYYLAEKK